MSSLKGQTAIMTGASMGIGEANARRLAEDGANVVLMSRSKDKLDKLKERILSKTPSAKVAVFAVDIQNFKDVDKAVEAAVVEFGSIDILVNNAELPIELIDQMNGTNISGLMYTTHSVLNRSMIPKEKGSILNISSVTALECPPFPGEAIYHANKACIEAFSNSLRTETSGTNIRVMVLRPSCVVAHCHLQRVNYDQKAIDDLFSGYLPLVAWEIANSASFMLARPESMTIKALDCVPPAQRSLVNFDLTWGKRNYGE
ncbi:short-chain dehydrogenase/ reductase-like protein [Leptodontidium sp. MPI-SDFR-AT-0119]|nr:short-chain dehydrogenase/ reductase-like protein [Leptodontidium sp. MPI-SDFR-AT-0119]